jgi:hypothetical protein
MNRLLITLSAALLTSVAHADPVCVALGQYSRTVMDARQTGVALSKIMEIVKGDDIHTRIVLDAYEQPRFQTEEFRRTAIQDFGNKWETMCYRVRGKKGSNV